MKRSCKTLFELSHPLNFTYCIQIKSRRKLFESDDENNEFDDLIKMV